MTLGKGQEPVVRVMQPPLARRTGCQVLPALRPGSSLSAWLDPEKALGSMTLGEGQEPVVRVMQPPLASQPSAELGGLCSFEWPAAVAWNLGY